MRIAGTLLTLIGLLLLVSGSFLGCGALFSWNGKHLVETKAVEPDKPFVHTIVPEPGRRYSVAVQVVFERGEAPPAAKLSIVARITDKSGAKLGETTGWIDPEEPPTVVYGSHQDARSELYAERAIGAFHTVSRDPVELRVDLGADRTGSSRILATRIVVYDDVTPAPIKRALVGAGVGGVLFVTGLVVLFLTLFRGRSRRGGIRGR